MRLGIDGEGSRRGRQGGESCRQTLSGHHCGLRWPTSLQREDPFSLLLCFMAGSGRKLGSKKHSVEVCRRALLFRGAAAEGRALATT